MRLKTYFASSVESAMQLALEQLGPEAMIVNSRKTSAENRHLGEYEVVFAPIPNQSRRQRPRPPKPPLRPQTPKPNPSSVSTTKSPVWLRKSNRSAAP